MSHWRMQGHRMQFDGLDVLGVAVAGSLVLSDSWYDHLAAWVPTPTAAYTVLGSVFLFVQILDKLGLLPRFGRRKDPRD